MTTARKIWKVSWRAAVCLLLLAWIFQAIFYNEARITLQQKGIDWYGLTRMARFNLAWQHGPSGLLTTLTTIDPKGLALAIVLMGLLLYVGMLRWQMVLKVHGLNLPFARIAEISLVAHFFNSFLLGSVGGDILKAYYVARETHHKKTEALVTVAVDRVIGLFSMLLFACVMMLPNTALLLNHRPLRILMWFIILMTIGCAGFMAVSFFGGVSKGVPKARLWLRKMPKGEMIERALEAFREFGRDRWFFVRILPVVILANVVCVIHFWSLIWGFKLQAPLITLAVVVPMVTTISTLPITPSGLGVRENLYVLMLATPEIGIPPAQALLISLVGYATSLFWSLIGGIVYLTRKNRDQLEAIAVESSAQSAS
ncbi:MAG: lysylphosphatidylglycerol synthase transmembrane domain-containing protein [Verrucomicrobiales bacterium]